MLTQEDRMKIKVLYEQGMKIKEIARNLGISKNTVKKVIREKINDTGSRTSKIEPYKEYLGIKIKEENYTNSRLFREIKMMGYEGRYGLVKNYLKGFRDTAQGDLTIRFETLPGQQAQADWTKMGLIELSEDVHKKHITCLSIVLGYSRTMYNEYFFNETLENLIDGHMRAFEYFGGVPREILYDCMKSVVLERYEGGIVKWNEKFSDFANYYGFKPILCPPYWPQTKGKVERPNQYIQRDFFLGRKFRDLVDINRQAMEWLNTVANVRVHGTTNEVPVIRLTEEKKYLVILTDKPYVYIREGERSCAKDCYLSFDGNRYSVPHHYCKSKKKFEIRANKEKLYIYDKQHVIAEHTITLARGQTITNPEHFKGLTKKSPTTIELQRIYGEFSYMGEISKKYLAGMKNAKVSHLTWNVKKILALVLSYSKAEVLAAMEHALKHEAFGYSYIRNICQKNEKRGPRGLHSVKEILTDVFKKYGIPDVETRDLTIYDQIIEKGDDL